MHTPQTPRPARSLTSRELAVVRAMLGVDFPGVETYRQQIDDLRVVGQCGCGCPSIDFGHPSVEGVEHRVDAEIEGTNDGLLLFTAGPWLDALEYAWIDEPIASELPDAGRLRVTAMGA